MIRYLILAIMCSIVDTSSAMNHNYQPQMVYGIQNINNYIDISIIRDGHRAYVYDTLRRHPQEAERLKLLLHQIENLSAVAQQGKRYGNAVRVSMYLPFRVAGGYADDLGFEYDNIIRMIGLSNHLNVR